MSEINSKAKQLALKMEDLLPISNTVEIAYKGRQHKKIRSDPGGFSSKINHFVVEFQTALRPGVMGPDYYAQVTLDARTGKVIKVPGGS